MVFTQKDGIVSRPHVFSRALRLLLLPCLCLTALLFGTAEPLRAELVTDWNATLEKVQKATKERVSGRSDAMLHIAIFDAVNGITPKYTPYYVIERAPKGASREAAAAYAAYTVLLALYPSEKATLETQLAQSLQQAGADGNNPAVDTGRAWGEKVARAILAWRETDGFRTTVEPFFGKKERSQWRPVIPNEDKPSVLPYLNRLTPFAMKSQAQFRPEPPPTLDSTQFAADLQEVRTYGGENSTVRTEEQTAIARFHSDDGVMHWNRIARSFVKPEADLLETARLFALFTIAIVDTSIYCFDAKFTYNYWRPITAIRETDPNWKPLLDTPMHPEYVSRHCALAGAGSTILIRFFGDKTPFESKTDALDANKQPLKKRQFANLTAICKEVVEARIMAGAHFRTADLVGDRDGRQIANYVLATQLTPLPGGLPNTEPAAH